MIWTIASILDWTKDYFTKHGIETPRLESEILLAHSLGLKRLNLLIQHERELKEPELAGFKQLILRRVKKEPTAYITGSKPFMALEFIITKAVLIPRPETEHIVEAIIDITKDDAELSSKPAISLLDIGTGSGALAVSAAHYLKNANITAVDISESALEIASQNAKKHSLEDRISFIKSDIFSNLQLDQTFDIIVSNPPYIPTAEIASLQNEIKDHEPMSALDGGPDGLSFYRRIIGESGKRLNPKGYLVLEIGFGMAEDIKNMMNESGIFEPAKLIRDYAGIERVVIGKRS